MAKPITYVGLDVHKDTIAVALAEAGLRGDLREHGKVPNTPTALKALAMKLASAGREPRFCYETGPCGYAIQRQLTEAGHECAVVAPSLILRKPGERIKFDAAGSQTIADAPGAGCAPAPDVHERGLSTGLTRVSQIASWAPRSALPPTGLDAVAPALAGKPQVRPCCWARGCAAVQRQGALQ